MTTERQRDEHHFAAHLAEYHQALIEGRRPSVLDPLSADTERLRDAERCVERLHAMWTRDGGAPCEALSSANGGDDEAALAPVQTIGRFRIERELGHGGAGIVLLALDPKLARHVALKVPRPEGLASRELRKRFLREAEAAARLNHPHIVKVHEVGEAGPICYIATEYCTGPSLDGWLATTATVTPRDAAAIVADLASGVHHAHARGVLHRDLKPSNVMLDVDGSTTAADDGGPLSALVAKVSDFGLAKLLEQEGDETRVGTLLGTPRYMAPEQADGRMRDVGIHTDVYALGTILYELLVGAPPHRGQTDSETLRRVLLDEPAPPRRLRGDVPLDLQAICLKCLEKEPQQRYVTAAALEDDLRRYLDGKPTVARPVGTAGRLWKWARRRPAVAGLSAVLAAALFTILVGSVIYNASLQRALTETARQREVARASAHRSRQLLYTADVHRAYEAWKNNRTGRVLEILDELIPRPDEVDLREFSWYYLRGLCERQLVTYRGHDGDVFGVASSPDGKLWASAGKDGTVRLWDAASDQPRNILKGHSNEVTCVAFAPNGEYLASAGEDHQVRLWSVPDGAPRGILSGHTDHVLCLAFSPDGNWLASGGRDDCVRVWDVAAGEAITVLKSDGADVCSLAFSGQGDALVAGDLDGSAHCWRAGTWTKLGGHRNETPESENMLALARSPTSRSIAGGGRKNIVYVWEAAEDGLRELRRLEGGHVERIQALAFSPTGEILASADKIGVVQLWDMQAPGQSQKILGHSGRTWSLAWAPDGRRLASAGADGTIRIWDPQMLAGGAVAYPTLPSRSKHITFTPDGKFLVASCRKRGVLWFDTATRELVNQDESIDDLEPRLRFSPNGSLLSGRNYDGRTWVRDRGTATDRLLLQGSALGYWPLEWSADGKCLATTVDKATGVIVEVETGKVVRRLEGATSPYDVVFSPDGRQLAVCRGNRSTVYALPSMELAAELELGGMVCYSADSRVLVTQWHSEACVYDARTLRLLHKFAADSKSISVALSPNGKTLAIQLIDEPAPARIVLWDVRTGQELLEIEPPGPMVNAILFSPSGDRLVAVGEDTAGKNHLWEWSIRRD